MTDSEDSLDFVEQALTKLRDVPVPEGPSAHILGVTAARFAVARNAGQCSSDDFRACSPVAVFVVRWPGGCVRSRDCRRRMDWLDRPLGDVRVRRGAG